MVIGAQNFNIDFLGANRQFDWLEISLTYGKNEKHNTIYDSYNVEKAATFVKSFELENTSKAYSLTNQIKYDVLIRLKYTYCTKHLLPGIAMDALLHH